MRQSACIHLSLLTLCFALTNVPAAPAQDLPPELTAPAAKHKADTEALEKQRQEDVAHAAKSYISALDSIEKSATAKGEIALVAAAVKEREAAAAGTLEPDLPAVLPKARLMMTRRSLLKTVERFNEDFAKRKQQADAAYLRVLAALQAKAAPDSEIAKQLAAEKSALLEGGAAAAAGTAAQAEKASLGKNVVVNGNFEKIVDGMPEGWKKPDWINIDFMTMNTERNNTFVRFDIAPLADVKTAGYFSFSQRLNMPKGARSVSVSARIRVDKDCEAGICVQVYFLDKNKKNTLYYVNAVVNNKKGVWATVQAEGYIPKEAETAVLALTNNRHPGQIDFDDVEVTFK